MLILLSPAKTFAKKSPSQRVFDQSTLPRFAEEAKVIAQAMSEYHTEQLGTMLKLSAKMAREAHQMWLDFSLDNVQAQVALASYSGIVFKYLNLAERSPHALAQAERYLRICSFCYGLLRPTDLIHTYRLEGTCRLELNHQVQSVFEYWRSILTQALIIECKQVSSGKLLFLASEEMKQLFHWSEVEQELEIYTPHFYSQTSQGLKQATVYTKMARGTMLADILEAEDITLEMLTSLSPLGFTYSAEHSTTQHLYYLLAQ